MAVKKKSKSPKETELIAREFAHGLASRRSREATVIALAGDLGSGKTTFIRGFVRGLGLRSAKSPTFILMRHHHLSDGRHLYHMDAYRLRAVSELGPLGFKEILADPKNIILIEWASNIRRALPKDTLWLRFAYGKEESEREITLPGLTFKSSKT